MSFSKFMIAAQKTRRHFAKPRVSVLVPAYNAQEFICETLDSLDNQVFRDFQILISIDKSDDDTKSIIERWCKEHKDIPVQIFYQTERLGWVKNINFLLKKCETKYFMILPHDDLIHKTYLDKMYHHIKANPSACVAYSDIQGFGVETPLITQDSIKGDRVERVHEFLTHHFAAVAIRGLANRSVLSDFILLSENNYSDIAIDSIWNMQMVLMGEMIRIPEVLYYKRYHGSSTHAQWWKCGKDEAVKAWLEHCTDCMKLIFMAGFNQEELIHLVEAGKSRLVQNTHQLCPHLELLALDEKERALSMYEFEKTITDLKARNKPISLKPLMKNI